MLQKLCPRRKNHTVMGIGTAGVVLRAPGQRTAPGETRENDGRKADE
ncbi:MAG TPA: hypothetical protein IAB28_09665 [Candidatus Copromonas faecavium]|uniref:Uncharacterized protein n=1 Tax=Candidatus Copromonas faecavium (nom. illeg.) TaxID=2840740 RepID=A0A9D1A548_9FIRM|nr:hypothetical protein [Candidatus Copromonas faecavium]